MADGIRCKNCGRYEADHIEGDPNWPKILGYPMTLKACAFNFNFGYDPEESGPAQRLADEAEERKKSFGQITNFSGIH